MLLSLTTLTLLLRRRKEHLACKKRARQILKTAVGRADRPAVTLESWAG